jgi:hypothetical protein
MRRLANIPAIAFSEWDYLPRQKKDPRPQGEEVLPKNERKFCYPYEYARTACRLPGAAIVETVLKWRSQAASNQFEDLVTVAAKIKDRVVWRLFVAFPEQAAKLTEDRLGKPLFREEAEWNLANSQSRPTYFSNASLAQPLLYPEENPNQKLIWIQPYFTEGNKDPSLVRRWVGPGRPQFGEPLLVDISYEGLSLAVPGRFSSFALAIQQHRQIIAGLHPAVFGC